MSIGQNLKQLRLDQGMTQEQAAQKLGVTRQALSGYETGRTRPDIDMLMRLARLYETDLDEILYGESQRLKWTRRLKRLAIGYGLLLAGLSLAGTFLLWYLNHFLYPTGPMSEETRWAIYERRFRLLDIRSAVGNIACAIAFLGAFLLVILVVAKRVVIPLRQKLLFLLVLSGGLILPAMAFSAIDPVYQRVEYLMTPAGIIGNAICFLLLDLGVEAIRKRKTNIKRILPRP